MKSRVIPMASLRNDVDVALSAAKQPDGQLSKTCQSRDKKIFRLAFDPTQMFNMCVSPDRGALRIVTGVAVRCGGR
ncbi:hypothetical protein [Bradyrhizobium elkanii]|uniref:hypothetical protein n=1 Tax=Bradyrhizobium elkanii TaxID=29448 RepID=UPI001BABC00B|nr:hypothetical protein [Bradyrhizobium elkanii]MBR1157644.1 hypothetical protein [Bradyrhizobium elkanii]